MVPEKRKLSAPGNPASASAIVEPAQCAGELAVTVTIAATSASPTVAGIEISPHACRTGHDPPAGDRTVEVKLARGARNERQSVFNNPRGLRFATSTLLPSLLTTTKIPLAGALSMAVLASMKSPIAAYDMPYRNILWCRRRLRRHWYDNAKA